MYAYSSAVGVQYLQYNCCRLNGMLFHFMLGPLLMPAVT